MVVWLVYHPGAKNVPRIRKAMDWIMKAFDPRSMPWFRDEFIHPNELVPLMRETRENFGLRGYAATGPG